ncbi:MAG TPA: DNA polymerase/3'-5' exonuclease PolX, partial [Nitrososphaeraceae archaeon]|nr:DNA polymerase/3'-5' exonuclease PolX [Nitrososphaeraceae archaeon]
IAKIFREISYLIQIAEKDPNTIYKVRAYEKAADVIERLSRSIEEIYLEDGIQGLKKISSIGNAISTKIEELIKSNKISYHEELKKKIPIKVSEFSNIKGFGPKTLKILFESLSVTNIAELEKAALEGKISKIKGFSKIKEEKIIKTIQLSRNVKTRYLLGDIYPLIKKIENRLSERDNVNRCLVVGSFRRMRETIGDIDILISTDQPEEVIEFFVSMPEVQEIKRKGKTKAFVELGNGIGVDLLVVAEESFGSAAQYFTGNKDHNISIRNLALSMDFHLNEWGLYNKKGKKIAGSNEQEIYERLQLQYIPPELRENCGEIQYFTEQSNMPLDLIDYGDLKGDLHIHSDITDGTMSISDMALHARKKFGLEYIAITDHTKSLRLANGLNEDQLLSQIQKIEQLNDTINQDSSDDTVPNFRILSSAEVNILKDGRLDISNNVLDKLDIVGASIHSNFSYSKEIQTNRLVEAAKNPSIDLIFHPTGRLINKREGYAVDMEKVIQVASETKTVLEINSSYNRLDLRDEHIRMAVENGVKLAINSDAHHPVHFAYLVFGIGQARRGWAKKIDIVNTLKAEPLLKSLK